MPPVEVVSLDWSHGVAMIVCLKHDGSACLSLCLSFLSVHLTVYMEVHEEGSPSHLLFMCVFVTEC